MKDKYNVIIKTNNLAKRTGTQKSYISRLENGKIDIQISTLFRIFEEGLGKHLELLISD